MSKHQNYEEIDRVSDAEGHVIAVIHRRVGTPHIRFKLCRRILIPDTEIERPETTVWMSKKHIPAVSRLIPLVNERMGDHLDRLQIDCYGGSRRG